jgi:hypothetical protein
MSLLHTIAYISVVNIISTNKYLFLPIIVAEKYPSAFPMKSKYPTPTLIPALQTNNEDEVNRSQIMVHAIIFMDKIKFRNTNIELNTTKKCSLTKYLHTTNYLIDLSFKVPNQNVQMARGKPVN